MGPTSFWVLLIEPPSREVPTQFAMGPGIRDPFRSSGDIPRTASQFLENYLKAHTALHVPTGTGIR
jgi:hypothetical protein